MEVRSLAEGLEFPEGPVALADGSVLLVEIFAGALARVSPDGTKTIVAVDWPVAGLRLNYAA